MPFAGVAFLWFVGVLRDREHGDVNRAAVQVRRAYANGRVKQIKTRLSRRAVPLHAIVIVIDHFTVELAARRVTQTEGEVTPTEWHIVEMLVRHAGCLDKQAACART